MESLFFVHPFHRPLRFLFDDVNVLYGIEEVFFFVLILDVGINEEGVGFWVDVFHGDLEAVKASSLGDLDFWAELLCKVFHDYSITGGEEGEYVFDEMFLIGVEFFPISEVLNKIDFFSGPEGGKMFFVHVVDWGVMDWEEDEPLLVLFEDGFWGVWRIEWVGFLHDYAWEKGAYESVWNLLYWLWLANWHLIINLAQKGLS